MLRAKGRESTIQQSRVRLYEDTVVRRKSSKLSSDEELTITTSRILRTSSSGEDYVSVELTGWRKQASVPKFEIDVSCPGCSYNVSEPELKITVSYSYAGKDGRIKKDHVLKMKSREQLTAWTAELIQASTFEPENTFQRCFHVTVPEIGSEHSEETEPTFEHYILQAHHPCNCQLVIRHPLSLRDVKLWDLSKTKAFTFEFFPNPLFRFQLTDELLSSDASSESEQVETVYFLSSLVARQALDLVELLLSTRMPKLYLKANKHVYTRQTSQGDVAKAVTFDFKSSSGPSGQQVLSKSFVDFEPKLPSYSPSRIGDKDASPYAVVDLPSMCTVAARLPPTDLLRPGIAQSRVLGDCDYVSMSRVEICDPPLPDNALTVGIQSSESDHDYDDVAEDVSVFDDDYELMAAGVTPSLTALTNCKVGGKQSEEEASSTDEPSSEVM